jgi:CMP-N,N'-diacetyllegionaminic acid synthase
MKILAIVPARGGSKGIPRKNIKPLSGKPLLAYTLEAASQCRGIHTLMVSTEDSEIADISASLGYPVPFMRPSELAQDFTPSVDVIVNIVNTYKQMDVFFDAVMLLEPTCPFRTVEEINECIEIFRKKDADSLITVKNVPAQFNPHWVFEEGNDTLLHKAIESENVISRRQILPKAYARDGSVYITKSEVLVNQHSIYGDTIAYRVNDNPMHVNIDSTDDWREAERKLSQYKSSKLSRVI